MISFDRYTRKSVLGNLFDGKDTSVVAKEEGQGGGAARDDDHEIEEGFVAEEEHVVLEDLGRPRLLQKQQQINQGTMA